MPFASALSTNEQTTKALDEVMTKAREQLGIQPALALLFFTPHHAGEAKYLAATVQQKLGPECLIGCTAESVAGTAIEVEQEPALSLFLARWPGDEASIEPFHLVLEETPDGQSLMGWPDSLAAPMKSPSQPVVMLLGDPFSFPVDQFLEEMNDDHTGMRVVGGMASGAQSPGCNRLLMGERVLDGGAVGLLLSTRQPARSIVSQGCRPIGRHFVVTKARENVILELGGKPPLTQLRELWHGLPPAEQQLFQQGLHVGLVINEYQSEFRRGDFLVRNILGVDNESGALAIADRTRVGQTIQFHVRDAATADEDLHALLQMDLNAHKRPSGALLFTCNGRGTRLFDAPNHDAAAIAAEVGSIPLAGFFAQGELGPIGGQNFIHGFTASVVLFEE